jgi:hypothetical protein
LHAPCRTPSVCNNRLTNLPSSAMLDLVIFLRASFLLAAIAVRYSRTQKKSSCTLTLLRLFLHIASLLFALVS